MESMDKGLTVPKWVLIAWLKIAQMPQNLSAQFVCSSPKYLDFNEKRLHWMSIARVFNVCKLFLWYYPKCRKQTYSLNFPSVQGYPRPDKASKVLYTSYSKCTNVRTNQLPDIEFTNLEQYWISERTTDFWSWAEELGG